MNKYFGLDVIEGRGEPPKPKLDKLNEAIINGQPDDTNNNNYEEPVTDNTPKKEEPEKQQENNAAKDFEYIDDGEANNSSNVTETDTNPKDEYL
jgi:hypothetical protein